MPKFLVGFEPLNKKVRVVSESEGVPEGFDDVGAFDTSEDDASGPKFNKVLQNEVRDLLYAAGQQNMQEVEITVSPAAYDEANGAFNPQDARTYGTALAPNAKPDEHTENSSQVEAVKRVARKARGLEEEAPKTPEGSEDTATSAGGSEAPAGKAK